MGKYVIEGETLEKLADALRSVTGQTRSYTPTEMIEAVSTIMETGTYILVDENGNEIPAVFVENETAFTATANDIRVGTTAVTDSGVTVGTKEIPAYYAWQGTRVVSSGSAFFIPTVHYDYTKFQAIICSFNTNLNNSVAAEKVVIDDTVYSVQSTTADADITKDGEKGWIVFNINNDTGRSCIIRYFMYKEMY